MNSTFEYVGHELDQAALATNWKTYFGSRLAPYIVGDVLEVGAGLGGTTVHLRDGRQRSWVCLEPDATLARKLEDRLAGDSSKVPTRVVVGDLSSVPESEQFDCILYIDVLEHIEDDRGEVIRAMGHLKPGGTLVVLCPAFMVLFSEMDRALGHFRRYTKSTLAAVFPPELRRVELFYLDSLGMIASLANKLLLKQGAPNEGQVRFWDGTIIPVSRVLDRVLLFALGRSVIAIYRKGPSNG
jgi:SAM-dependent methyltransferase